ncbi:hypothetical protein [Deinococcus peraridilitoris]|uniref:Uncharacterized protein n=1 Tax=Deinococcus peraridilitoris (strain DSM 19664 / LMG 22246 / CIP 109416 / KR-200) TaxID=937777 RepID=K9ZZR9_DEIPD|nr:hypothetical protein [Deinococcus peraridilitoris]AFZ67086.1 hypothetical protein Deipe_1545 [Deinococcus peraridilitoris DSM 19664]
MNPYRITVRIDNGRVISPMQGTVIESNHPDIKVLIEAVFDNGSAPSQGFAPEPFVTVNGATFPARLVSQNVQHPLEIILEIPAP